MKLKGFSLQLQLVLVLLMIVIIAASSFAFISARNNHRRNQRTREIEAIQVALMKYASTHHGAIPPSGTFTTTSFSVSSNPYFYFVFQKPGLFPKDLNELVELGYLPASFFDKELKGNEASYKVAHSGTTYLTPGNEESISQTYGNDTDGQYTYTVYRNPNDLTTAQYSKCELTFKCSEFTIGPVVMNVSGQSY